MTAYVSAGLDLFRQLTTLWSSSKIPQLNRECLICIAKHIQDKQTLYDFSLCNHMTLSIVNEMSNQPVTVIELPLDFSLFEEESYDEDEPLLQRRQRSRCPIKCCSWYSSIN
jgi:hypothetical protein